MGALINQKLVDLDTFFQIALEKAVRLTGYDDGIIYLGNDEKQILERKYRFHPQASPRESISIRYGEGVSGKAFILKQPVITSIDEYLSYRPAPILKSRRDSDIDGLPSSC